MTLSGNGKEEIRSFQLVATGLCCSDSLQGHTASTAVVNTADKAAAAFVQMLLMSTANT